MPACCWRKRSTLRQIDEGNSTPRVFATLAEHCHLTAVGTRLQVAPFEFGDLRHAQAGDVQQAQQDLVAPAGLYGEQSVNVGLARRVDCNWLAGREDSDGGLRGAPGSFAGELVGRAGVLQQEAVAD